MSVNGEGKWRHIVDCHYQEQETEVILDDMLFIFHDDVIRKGAFEPFYDCNKQHEWTQSWAWKSRGIPLHVIGIYLVNLA
jgi:hypothetical protein